MRLYLAVLVLCVGSLLAEKASLHGWLKFKKQHTKSYADSAEELARFKIWKSNLEFVEKHNKEADSGIHTYWVRMNKFGDLTSAEFGRLYNGFNASLRSTSPFSVPLKTHVYNAKMQVPASVDWREQGYVTDVKDQGQCGSCWSFSATGSLEGQNFKKTGKLVALSEQNLVDCSGSFGNEGCNGGLMDQAFQYVQANGGIDTEDSYPYEAEDDTCRFSKDNVGGTDTGFVDVKSGDENALMQAVATVGPVSVAIDASHSSFQMYSHGIYYAFLCSSSSLDHGVLAVGYATDNATKKDYWIVKNSWGDSWGENGYIKMSRNRNNNCGIATQASYPVV